MRWTEYEEKEAVLMLDLSVIDPGMGLGLMRFEKL